MWLSLLLSVGAEASAASVRKAGLRELAQRLRVAQTRVRPGLYGRVEAWLASHPEAPEAARAVLREPRVGLLLEELLAHLQGTDTEEDPEGIQFVFETQKEGFPVVHVHDREIGWTVRPATVPTPFDATIGWWLEQVLRIQRERTEQNLWTKMERVGLLESGATARVQDWIEMTHPDLGRYTWAAAKDASDAWHRALGGSAGYGKPITGGDVRLLATWPDGARLVQLMSKRDFAAEGTSMGHCVGGNHEVDEPAPGNGHYWQGHRDGRYAILSYRDSEGRPLLTLNLERSGGGRPEVEQAQGPMDETPPVEASFRVLAWLVGFYRALGAPEEFLEKGIATLFRVPVESLFLSEEGRAILLASTDPFHLGSFEALESARRANDREAIDDAVRSLEGAVRHSTGAHWVGSIDLAPVGAVSAGLLHDAGRAPVFFFGPKLGLSFGIGSAEEISPYGVTFELEASESGGDVVPTWSVYQRDETLNDLEDLDVPFDVDLNPFPFLDAQGLLFNVDRFLAWMRPRIETHDAEAFDVTVVAPPLLGGVPVA